MSNFPTPLGSSSASSSGFPSPLGSSSSGLPSTLEGLLAQLQARGVEPDQGGGHTPWGFVGNLLGGVADMGTGIASLIGAGVSDVGSALSEAVTLGNAETDSKLLPVGKAIAGFTDHGFHPTESVVIQDLVKRYGPLAPGGRPANEFLQEVYDNPAAFALDAASVAAGGAKLAKVAGESALGGSVTDAARAITAAEDAARVGLPVAPGVTAPAGALETAARSLLEMKGAGVPARSAESAAVRTGLDALAESGGSGIPSFAKRLLPEQTYRVVEAGSSGATQFIPSTTAYNPFNRLFTSPIRKLMTEPIAKLEGISSDLRSGMKAGVLDEARSPLSREIATADLYDEIVQGAVDRGMNRIDIAPLRKSFYPKVLSKRIEKTLAADSLRLREKEVKEMHDLIVQAAEEDRAFNFANMDKYDVTSTGSDVTVNGMRAEPWGETRFAEMRPDKTIDLADAPDTVIDTEMLPQVREALAADPLLNRVDDVVERLKDVRAKFDDPNMPEWGWDVAAEQGAVDRIIRSLNKAMERRAAGYDNPATKLSDHARVIDIENRLPVLENFESTPTGYLDRVYGALKQKYLTGGLRAENPGLATKASVLQRVEELSKLEYEVRSLLSRRTQKGMIRTIRKMLGEEKYAGARQVLESMADDPAALVDELVRRDPEGGLLKQLLEGRPAKAYSKPGRANTVETSVGAVTDVRQVNRATRHPVGEAQAIWDTIDGLPADEATKNALRERYRVWAESDGTDAKLQEIYRDIGRVTGEPDSVIRSRIAEAAQRGTVTKYTESLPAPEAPLRAAPTAVKESTVGVAMTLQQELLDAIGDPRVFASIFQGADSTRSLMKRLREVLADPVSTQRNALRGLDNSPDALLLDDAFVRGDLVQPTYFPYIRKEGAGGGDFFPMKKATGANILARDPHEARFYGTLLKEGNYITDPIEAFSRRAARRAREVNTYNSWSTRIKKMGRVVTDAEQIPDGWVAVSPDALFLKHRIHMQFLEKFEDYRLNGLDGDAAFARALEDVGHRTLDDLDTLIGEGKPTVYAIPKALDEEMGAAAKWARAGGGKYVRAIYDPFMNTWRSLVLTGSPRWVVNNILGNTVMGAMQGVKVMDVTRILTERLRALMAGWVKKHPQLEAIIGDLGGEELRKNSLAGRVAEMPYEGLTGSGFFGKNNLEAYRPNLGKDAAETKIGRAVQAMRTPGTKSYATMSVPRKWSEAVRSLNGEIEASFREASFLTAVEKQMGKSAIQRTGRTFWNSKRRIEDIMNSGYDEAAARAAVEEVDHFFGNYTALGPFERHVMRRWLVPFWGFYKHTVKLMMTFPVQYPLRAQVLRGLSLATQEMVKEYGPMPGWLEGAIPLSPPGGEVSFLRTAGANPFTGMFEDPTQMLSPALKVFLEQSMGKDMFTGETFTDRNTYTPFGSDQSYSLETLQPVANPRPGILEHLLSNIPQYDMIKQALAGGKTYDTTSILDVLSGESAILDPATGQPKYPVGWTDQLKKLSGFNVSPYDLGAYQENLSEEQKMALTEALKRMQAEAMA